MELHDYMKCDAVVFFVIGGAAVGWGMLLTALFGWWI